MFEVTLPKLGEGIDKATVAYWHCRPGEAVHKDDDLVEVITDKATFNIPAEASGIVERICISVGQETAVGSVLAILKT